MKYVVQFFTTSVVAFGVTSVVSFFYSLLAHGSGTIDWGTAIRMALFLGIIFPVLSFLESKKKTPPGRSSE